MIRSGSRERILVTGAGGQLGKELVQLLKVKNIEVYGLARDQLDITDCDTVLKQVEQLSPTAIIHAAAYTQVDRAEAEPEIAFRCNAIGTRNVAVAAAKVGAKLVYVSTDYVFDGSEGSSYNEWSKTSPINVYGQSKLAGEQFVRHHHNRFFIVRTSWVYGAYGNNFVKTMLKLGAEHGAVRVVEDQVGSPTYTYDLAMTIIAMLQTEKYGLYHISNTGKCSWFEFAQEIFKQAKMEVQVTPISTSDMPRPAARPAYSVMEPVMLRLNDFPLLPTWQQALHHYLQNNRTD
ncbi:dTDP-4-dehydrorhamnose reductase [Paenibacillus sp. GCM10012307]|uniref:dTDP-4-dehydrorhamnose reductase n=1 Tax=Paenibacillus roseus TaxID=2798579 RepID=A0A934MTP0_9BACL|nr:dTDP-4-dehydrorhamnose reductase [Paenibacillus roseus]MBJ6360252.1 dTDP-4-dehydrorhamnose reductase [Paenibacillus roseus]